MSTALEINKPAKLINDADFTSQEKRVLVVVRWPLGGIRTHILYTFPALQEANYRFTFIGPDNNSFRDFADSLIHFPGIEFIGVPTNGKQCHLWKQVRKSVRENRFGLIHSQGMTAAANASLGNLFQKVPHLATVHGVFFPNEFDGIKGWIKKGIMNQVVRRIDTLIGVSQDVCDHMESHFPFLSKASKVYSIPNRINISKYNNSQPAESFLREKHGFKPETCLLGFLGRYVEEKGFRILLKALEILKQQALPRPIHLVAVGSGDCRQNYEKEIRDKQLDSLVTMVDYTSEVIPYLRQFDLLVVPSLLEASSLVSMEAMAVGIPVLGSDCIGLREVLRGTPSISFQTGNPHDLALKIRSAIADPWNEDARAFAPRARELFDSRLSGEAFLQVYNAMYKVNA